MKLLFKTDYNDSKYCHKIKNVYNERICPYFYTTTSFDDFRILIGNCSLFEAPGCSCQLKVDPLNGFFMRDEKCIENEISQDSSADIFYELSLIDRILIIIEENFDKLNFKFGYEQYTITTYFGPKEENGLKSFNVWFKKRDEKYYFLISDPRCSSYPKDICELDNIKHKKLIDKINNKINEYNKISDDEYLFKFFNEMNKHINK